MSRRTVVWFSAGAASAVAAKLTLAKATGPVDVVYTNPGSEHPDNQRFELDPDRGNYASEMAPECSLLCVIAEEEFNK